MEYGNKTKLNEFILLGFSCNLKICILQFIFFLLIYTLTVLGNSFLICAVITSPQLHTPMYYFLCNLSFIDLLYSSCSVPKMLTDVFSKRKTISVIGCVTQMSTTLFLGSTECLILAVMAYDRYIAIRFPLHYTIYMNWKTCQIIAVIIWVGNFIYVITPIILKPLVFCKENIMDHFVCEVLALLELVCGEVPLYKAIIFFGSLFSVLTPLVFIIMSYIFIIISILNIHSAGGRSKAFSTCASHLTVVFMFYGTLMAMYTGQTKRFSYNLKYIALVYLVITPLLNPLIYSLRNNDVKEAFKAIMSKSSASWVR